jgi:superfamily I DNA/RNA helicase
MQLVRIAGPTEAMRRLQEVDGLQFERTSANRLDDDTWQVAGYATDEALAELKTRGLETELVVPPEKLAEERAVLYAAITREEDEPGPEASSAADPEGTAAAEPDGPAPAAPEAGDS